jgi:hypothetical protein
VCVCACGCARMSVCLCALVRECQRPCVCVWPHVAACVRLCACVRVAACVRPCVRVCVHSRGREAAHAWGVRARIRPVCALVCLFTLRGGPPACLPSLRWPPRPTAPPTARLSAPPPAQRRPLVGAAHLLACVCARALRAFIFVDMDMYMWTHIHVEMYA